MSEHSEQLPENANNSIIYPIWPVFVIFSLEFLGSSSDFPVGLDDAIDLHIPILLKGSSQGLEILRAKVQDPEQGLDVAVLDSAKRYLPRFQGNKGHLSRMKHKNT